MPATVEEIKEYLEGYDDQKYIVGVESSYRENKISTYYLAIAYFINLIQITNELSSIYGGSQYEVLGTKSFTFYLAELLFCGILYASVFLFINKKRTLNAHL